ncbi:MAG: HRDC domain-containing protein [Anaerolineales bacterium]|nr:HRDC domain-containing protein [Anaerolineales bacterium]
MPQPTLIETDADLRQLVTTLVAQPALAVDTESNSLFVYRERLCLIQFSTPTADYIVDPLQADARLLAPLFANSAQEKIFHAAEYDLICLTRDFNIQTTNLFDTMVAARSLGWPQTGLASLLELHFGVKMNKKHQRANWGRRPLTPDLLDYARMDTHYLFALRALLEKELRAAGRWEETQEEFARLAKFKWEAVPVDPHAFWRVSRSRDLSGQQAAVLQELWQYREKMAERADVPPFKMMGDETLLALAKKLPQTAEELRGVHGMTEGQIRRHGDQVLNAVHRGLKASPVKPPKPKLEPEPVRERFERLRVWRKEKAKTRGVESDVILPKEAMWEMARRAPRTLEELAGLEHLGPWRRNAYGDELVQVLNT